MKTKHIVRIIFSIVWTLFGILLMSAATYDPEYAHQLVIRNSQLDTILVLRDGRYWYHNIWLFLLYMIPVFGVWLYPKWKEKQDNKPASDKKPVKRRSRMF